MNLGDFVEIRRKVSLFSVFVETLLSFTKFCREVFILADHVSFITGMFACFVDEGVLPRRLLAETQDPL